MMRNTIRNPSDGARPQKNDDTVNPETASSRSRFRPKRPANHPVIGRMMALATRYEVKVQVASSTVDDRFPAMCGNDTFTTVVSSTSIKVLDMTAMAISQGLISGRACGLELIVLGYGSRYIRFDIPTLGFMEKLASINPAIRRHLTFK